ncbi:MAG: hypothetical protein WCI67_22695, partial [Chloroflexales bacterium]
MLLTTFLLGLGGFAAQAQQKKNVGAAQPPPRARRDAAIIAAMKTTRQLSWLALCLALAAACAAPP